MRYPILLPAHPVIHTMSAESLGLMIPQVAISAFASGAYPAANRAIFVPFHINQYITLTKLAAYTGTAIGDNIDVGIYTAEPGGGTRLVSSGGAAQSGSSSLQIFDVTDTGLGPGDYYLAVAINGTTSTLMRSTLTILAVKGTGMAQMASAYPLPATATFATISTAYIPLIGLLHGRTVL